MAKSHGYRSGTRHIFSKPFRQHGAPNLTTYMHVYRRGDHVDIKANSSIHKGMPHKVYHGKTGVVFDVTPRAIAVDCTKLVGNHISRKRVYVRREHVRPSRCREDFLQRIKASQQAIDLAKKNNVPYVPLKRQPVGPRPHFIVPIDSVKMETLKPMPYVELY